ncbi:MAG: hypothetical protein IT480_14300 [Gammaproteobacteria bacterium]|nr:hypothetical protein [Gammaproteobacteria bacterium]
MPASIAELHATCALPDWLLELLLQERGRSQVDDERLPVYAFLQFFDHGLGLLDLPALDAEARQRVRSYRESLRDALTLEGA